MSTHPETLGDLLAVISDYGERPAVITMQEDGAETWSYSELDANVRSLAAGLLDSGFEPGSTAGLLADSSPEWLAAALAVIRAGGVVLPMDNQVGKDNLLHILNDSEVGAVFVNEQQGERIRRLVPENTPRLIRLDTEEGEESWRQLMNREEKEFPEPELEDQAALFYTSGTTGPPKGVPLSHRNIAFQITTVRETDLVRTSDRVLLPLPLHHVYPFVIGMLVPLALGLPIILPRALTGPQILKAIREQEATVVIGVPRLYRALLAGIVSQAESRGRIAGIIFHALLQLSTLLRRRFGLMIGRQILRPVHRQFGPSLRMLASGGSALDSELAWQLEGLGWQVAVGYGLTETAPLLTIKLPGGGKLDSVGPPVPGVELRIAPGEDTASQQSGDTEAGEVLARGPNVFAGYRGLPDKTAEALDEDNWFHTGDLGYLDRDGNLHLTGRASTLIVTESGENVQPDAVEKVYDEHPVIAETGVLEKDGRLVAVIIPDLRAVRERNQDIEEAVRQAVNDQERQLPSYQRLGEYVISRQALPRTRLGKIKRHLLRERFEQAGGEQEDKEAAGKGPIPLSEMNDQDQALLDNPAAKLVWEWLADRHPDVRLTPDISPQLDLGIDSLEWLNLTMEISQQTGRELDEEAIGRIETVRDLLQVVAEKESGGEKVDPERPLTSPDEVLDSGQKRWLRPLGPVNKVLRKIAYLGNRLVMRLLFRLRVDGLDRLPRDAQFVLTPNHASLLDPFIVAAALPLTALDRMFFAGWTGIAFGNPLFRFGSRLARAVPIDSRKAVASSLAFGAVILKQGDCLIWFPEGERSQDGSLQRFKSGIGMLLKHYPVRVVPVHIRGAHEALPPGRVFPRLTGISLLIGDPLDIEPLVEEAGQDEVEKEIISQIRKRMEELAARDNQPR